jgi:hypothetical protein
MYLGEIQNLAEIHQEKAKNNTVERKQKHFKL